MRKPVLVHKCLTSGEFEEGVKGIPLHLYPKALELFHVFSLFTNGTTWVWYYLGAIARVIPFNRVGELVAEIERRLDEMLASDSTPPAPFEFFDAAALAVLVPTPKPKSGVRLFNLTSTSSSLSTPRAEGVLETRN